MIQGTVQVSENWKYKIWFETVWIFTNQVVTVNTLARQLLHNEHPNSDDVIARQNQLNNRYQDLQNLADNKKGNLSMAHDVNTWHIECQETMVSTIWLVEIDLLFCYFTSFLSLKKKFNHK